MSDSNSVIRNLILSMIVGMVCAGLIFYPVLEDVHAQDDWSEYDLGGLEYNDQTLYLRGERYSYDGTTGNWNTYYYWTYPVKSNISVIFEIKYIRSEDIYVPVYSFQYSGEFVYDNLENTTIYFPLPSGIISDMVVSVNNVALEKIEVEHNNLKINLTQENSTVNIGFISRGIMGYSHEVPKNSFVKEFSMRVEIKGVGTDKLILENGFAPNKVTSSESYTVLKWDNENAVLRENVVIDFKTKTIEEPSDPQDFFSNFIFLFPVFGIMIAGFYSEGFKRLERDEKHENIVFLVLPYLVLCVLLWALIFQIGVEQGLIVSLLGFAFVKVIMDKKAVQISKGMLEFFIIPFFILLILIGIVIEDDAVAAALLLLSPLVVILVLTSFLLKYPRQENRVRRGFLRKKSSPVNKDVTSDNVNTLKVNETKGFKINKNYCPYCGYGISDMFDFCPKCGQTVSSIIKCNSCGILRQNVDVEPFCPNCGSQES